MFIEFPVSALDFDGISHIKLHCTPSSVLIPRYFYEMLVNNYASDIKKKYCELVENAGLNFEVHDG